MTKLTKATRAQRLMRSKLRLADQHSKAWRECHHHLNAIYAEFGADAVRREYQRQRGHRL